MAYVLLNVELGTEEDILREVRMLPGFVEAHTVFGAFDVIVKVDVENINELREHVYEKIRVLDKVRATTTMVVSATEKRKFSEKDL